MRYAVVRKAEPDKVIRLFNTYSEASYFITDFAGPEWGKWEIKELEAIGEDYEVIDT